MKKDGDILRYTDDRLGKDQAKSGESSGELAPPTDQEFLDAVKDAGYEVAFDVAPDGALDRESKSWHLMECDRCGYKERMSLAVESVACPKKCTGTMRPVDGGIGRRIAGYDHAASTEELDRDELPRDIEQDLEAAFDTGGDVEEAAIPDARERPVDIFVTAMRATRKVTRALKAGYSDVKTVRVVCVDCRLACIIAESTQAEIDHATCVGKRAEVICLECCKKNGVNPDAGGITEGQAKELSLILMKRSVRRENAN